MEEQSISYHLVRLYLTLELNYTSLTTLEGITYVATQHITVHVYDHVYVQ